VQKIRVAAIFIVWRLSPRCRATPCRPGGVVCQVPLAIAIPAPLSPPPLTHALSLIVANRLYTVTDTLDPNGSRHHGPVNRLSTYPPHNFAIPKVSTPTNIPAGMVRM